MQSAAVLCVKSRAPLMTVISSWDRFPPNPSFKPWASTSAFSWALLNKACQTQRTLTLTLLSFLRGVENCRVPSGLLDWDTAVHVRAISDTSTAFAVGAKSFLRLQLTCKLYDVDFALVTHCWYVTAVGYRCW